MATTNDITGDALVSKPATERFRDNYDLIFSGTKKPDDGDKKVGTIDRVVKQISDGAIVPPGGFMIDKKRNGACT